VPAAALDPLIQLAVGISVSPGGYAVLIGSGVSMEAGIPTGEQVLRSTKERLYRTKNEVNAPGPAELEQWLRDEGLDAVGYSDLLEAVLPTEQGRRDYLANFFEGKSPGPTHRVLADMAAEGLVRIFITTNFDPLLEEALRARGVSYVMVSDAASLESAPARETVACFVVKAHGDAGQLTVRNTLAEIETLE
jgi:NAD-dependent SIR2 family protein deacetylase